MKIYDTFEAGYKDLLYQPGANFRGSFLWRAKGGFIKAATFDAGIARTFQPKRYRAQEAGR